MFQGSRASYSSALFARGSALNKAVRWPYGSTPLALQVSANEYRFAEQALRQRAVQMLQLQRLQFIENRPAVRGTCPLAPRRRLLCGLRFNRKQLERLRSIMADLKSPEGVELIRRLVARADGMIEGFRPGVMERLGLGPDVCLELKPSLVYGRMTG